MEQKGFSKGGLGKKFGCINRKGNKKLFEQFYSLEKRDHIQAERIEMAIQKARELTEDTAIIVEDGEETPINESEYMRFLSQELVTTRWMGFNKL